ncbi:hypothetical protein [Actinoplanes sp. NPDC049681]|uniref:hypothetical protein n=1 Tax=Actinoplanes sp. NPDC049681 TaxID=3363905 RepID=UPI0037887F9C
MTAVLVSAASAVALQLVDANKAKDAVRDRDAGQFIDSFAAGDALQVTLYNIHDAGDSWTSAFSVENRAAARPFIENTTLGYPFNSITPFDYYSSVLDAGGFALGGAVLSLEVEGKRNQEVTIFGVHVDRHAVKYPLGAAILVYNQGGDTKQMHIDLDKPVPTPVTMDVNGPTKELFFRAHRIGLTSGKKETLDIELVTARSAYEFTLALDYEVGGKKYTQVIDRGGQPFRVAPAPCVGQNFGGLLPKERINSDGSPIFGQVGQRKWITAEQEYRMEVVPASNVCDRSGG